MSGREPEKQRRTEDEPDFAEEHTRPTYEEEHTDSPGVTGDESVPEGPGGASHKDPKRPL
ncbi:hypothetical protein [Haloactinomyces albus]|uniref:Uncharacterized protein n=1 Tax=Haloactinomyces albus TaxID=1352928 RepID=A0AAE3ZK35_9ACTN|nr:hypothetical protein [Haloactinomyces albus]MDR7304304.1 hypothetical protein [Haloactinomyces albus]